MAKDTSTRRARGSDGLYYAPSRGMWVGSIDLIEDGTGKRRRKYVSARKQEDALAKLRKARANLERTGHAGDNKITVDAWLTEWLTTIVAQRVRPTTLAWYASIVKEHVSPALGRKRLAELTPAQVRQAEQAVNAAGKNSTARAFHRVIRAALTDAHKDGLIPRNVAEHVKPPASTSTEREALTAAEATTLVEATADDPMNSRWIFALYTGTRRGEGIGLEWERVDLDAGTADISWQLQRLKLTSEGVPDVRKEFEYRPLAGGLVLTRPKTTAGQRVIPLPPLVLDALKAHGKDRVKRGLVWTNPDGTPIDPRADSRAWTAAVTKAKVTKVPLHSARHTTATLLLEAGVDGRVVQQILGHSTVTVSHGYQHVSLDLAREALGRIAGR